MQKGSTSVAAVHPSRSNLISSVRDSREVIGCVNQWPYNVLQVDLYTYVTSTANEETAPSLSIYSTQNLEKKKQLCLRR